MNATIGLQITIKIGHLIGTWEFAELSGWGSDGQSARLMQIGKSGKRISRGINLSAAELAKIGVVLEVKAATPATPENPKAATVKSDAWTAKREAQARRGLALLEGIVAGQPIISARDRSRREKAFRLLATA